MIRHKTQYDSVTWPAFVDVLATLLLLVVFLMMVFFVAHAVLGKALRGSTQEVQVLAEALGLSEEEVDVLGSALGNSERRYSTLQASFDAQATQLAETQLQLQQALSENATYRERLEADERTRFDQADRLSVLRSERDELAETVLAIQAQLAALNQALEAAEAQNREQRVQIVNLGQRLNEALATKVQELADARSAFFAALRESLGGRDDIRIEGDRFVFPAEIFFASGSGALDESGEAQLLQLAASLQAVSEQIPPSIDWVLRIDGHTDDVPIQNPVYPSNWELSQARALAVTRFLIEAGGLAPGRLAPLGFGEYHPLDDRDTPAARRRNRRIEFKLTQR